MTEKEFTLEGLSIELSENAERITELLKEKKYSEVKEIIVDLPAPDIAEIYAEIPIELETLFFRLLPKELAEDYRVKGEAMLAKALPLADKIYETVLAAM